MVVLEGAFAAGFLAVAGADFAFVDPDLPRLAGFLAPVDFALVGRFLGFEGDLVLLLASALLTSAPGDGLTSSEFTAVLVVSASVAGDFAESVDTFRRTFEIVTRG